MNLPDKLPESYERQMLENFKAFAKRQDKQRKGIKKVSIRSVKFFAKTARQVLSSYCITATAPPKKWLFRCLKGAVYGICANVIIIIETKQRMPFIPKEDKRHYCFSKPMK